MRRNGRVRMLRDTYSTRSVGTLFHASTECACCSVAPTDVKDTFFFWADMMHVVIVMEHNKWETQEWMEPKFAVLVEENRAARIVGHVKSFLKNTVINMVRRFLQGNNMPFSRNLFLECVFLSTSGPRVPVVDAEPLLHR